MKNWQRLRKNPKLKQQFLMREKVIDGVRAFFKKQNFHEVETPLLVRSPGTEPYLEVFETKLKSPGGGQNSKNTQAFLLTSPEYAMKKLLVAGMGNIFQICKSFRNNEGSSERHNPEFTILEWYRTPADYTDIMSDFEKMLLSLNNGKSELTYQNKKYDISAPYPRISVAEAFQKYVGVSAEDLLSEEKLIKVLKQKNYQITPETDWESAYHQLFLNEIEPELAKLKTPIFVYDYPASQAALSKKKASDPRFAERFEVYLAGLELGNAFSELTDAAEQESRLREELALRDKLGKTEYQLDEDFIEALKAGMPESGGIAVGVDRLVMLLADVADIDETLFFPSREVFHT